MFRPIKNLAGLDYHMLLVHSEDIYRNNELNMIFDKWNKKYGNNVNLNEDDDTNKNKSLPQSTVLYLHCAGAGEPCFFCRHTVPLLPFDSPSFHSSVIIVPTGINPTIPHKSGKSAGKMLRTRSPSSELPSNPVLQKIL